MKRLVIYICAAFVLVGCHLLTPGDPELDPPELIPEEVAWDKLDIARVMDFTQIPRIDCPIIKSALTGSGKCLPHKMTIGVGIRCPLVPPASELVFACLTPKDEPKGVPAVYFRMTWDRFAKDVAFDRYLGPCHVESAGLTPETARYDTDTGYRVCIFDETTFLRMPDVRQAPETAREFVSAVRPDPVFDRPMGLYLDMRDQAYADDVLSFMAQSRIFDGPLSIVLDSRFLTEDERKQALENVLVLFAMYREATNVDSGTVGE